MLFPFLLLVLSAGLAWGQETVVTTFVAGNGGTYVLIEVAPPLTFHSDATTICDDFDGLPGASLYFPTVAFGDAVFSSTLSSVLAQFPPPNTSVPPLVALNGPTASNVLTALTFYLQTPPACPYASSSQYTYYYCAGTDLSSTTWLYDTVLCALAVTGSASTTTTTTYVSPVITSLSLTTSITSSDVVTFDVTATLTFTQTSVQTSTLTQSTTTTSTSLTSSISSALTTTSTTETQFTATTTSTTLSLTMQTTTTTTESTTVVSTSQTIDTLFTCPVSPTSTSTSTLLLSN
jgi:hypothetical protein